MLEQVYNLLKNIKSFEDLVNILEKVPAENGGATIRGFILSYMEDKFPVEFEEWLSYGRF